MRRRLMARAADLEDGVRGVCVHRRCSDHRLVKNFPLSSFLSGDIDAIIQEVRSESKTSQTPETRVFLCLLL